MHTTSTLRPEGRRGVEWEFQKLTISREFSRNVVTRLLVEHAEHGGWELDRVRVSARRHPARRAAAQDHPPARDAPARLSLRPRRRRVSGNCGW